MKTSEEYAALATDFALHSDMTNVYALLAIAAAIKELQATLNFR